MKPNFLIVGAAKSGTTALYYYLSQHPEIKFPTLKEPKYFSSKALKFPHNGVGDESVDKYAIKEENKYFTLFEGFDQYKAVGEASPDYLFYHEKVAPSIYETLGDIKIIIVLRDPVKRAFSAYSYLKRDSRESLPFREALDAEQTRSENNWDFIWSYKQAGLYYEQVKTYIERFSNVQVLFQSDLKEKPKELFEDLFRFLGVDPYVKIDTSIENNQSGVPSNTISKFLLSRNNPVSPVIREVMKKVVPRSLLEKVSAKSLKKLELSEEDSKFLRKFYLEDINKLEDLLKVNLSLWK